MGDFETLADVGEKLSATVIPEGRKGMPINRVIKLFKEDWNVNLFELVLKFGYRDLRSMITDMREFVRMQSVGPYEHLAVVENEDNIHVTDLVNRTKKKLAKKPKGPIKKIVHLNVSNNMAARLSSSNRVIYGNISYRPGQAKPNGQFMSFQPHGRFMSSQPHGRFMSSQSSSNTSTNYQKIDFSASLRPQQRFAQSSQSSNAFTNSTSFQKLDFSASFAAPRTHQRFVQPPGASGNRFQGFNTSQYKAPPSANSRNNDLQAFRTRTTSQSSVCGSISCPSLPAEKTMPPPTDPSVVVPVKIEASGSKEVSMTFEQLVRIIARAEEILLENLKEEVLQEYGVTLDMKTINTLLDTTCRIPLAAFRMSGRVKGLIEACALPGSRHIKLKYVGPAYESEDDSGSVAASTTSSDRESKEDSGQNNPTQIRKLVLEIYKRAERGVFNFLELIGGLDLPEECHIFIQRLLREYGDYFDFSFTPFGPLLFPRPSAPGMQG